MFRQLIFTICKVLTIPLVPIFLFEGNKIRESVPRLPEARGAKLGACGNYKDTISLVTLGESTIAGVGVENHTEGITGQIAVTLSESTQKSVR